MDENIPEVSVDKLMERIREELKRRKTADFHPENTQQLDARSNERGSHSESYEHHAEPLLEAPKSVQKEDGYRIDDFMSYQEGEFLTRAYLAILRRPPDRVGYDHYLQKLRDGTLSRVEVLGRLRYAREGRTESVRVRGLFISFVLHTFYRIPLLGYLARLIVALVQLPSVVTNLRNEISHHRWEVERLNHSLEDTRINLAGLSQLVSGLVHSKMDRNEFDALIEDLKISKVDRNEFDALIEDLRTSKADRNESEALFGDLRTSKADRQEVAELQHGLSVIRRQIKDHKLNLLDQQRRVVFLLEEARKRLPEPMSTDQIQNMLTEEEHLLDVFYASFEDMFRGTREEIKERQKVYLRYMEQAGAGTDLAPVLDLGCGRGEWLELLKEMGFVAWGVDRNRLMIRQCEELGLDIFEADIMEFLRNQKGNSFSAITGFHLVEHLPLKTMVSLIDESLRVLVPGGLLIFETPNPQNLIVGACNFYIDPTHKNPLYPHTLAFLLEQRGFSGCEIIKLHPMNYYNVDDDLHESIKSILMLFNEFQDFAVVCMKTK